ncbi:MAG: hypothetical protein RSE00_05035 [Clostridia bacterium]
MKKHSKNNIHWRKLDNTAKIFPIISNKKFSNIFRMSVLLTDPIDPNTLEKAIHETLPIFKAFRVKLKLGFFWYYFETNKKSPKVELEKTYPCKYIDKNKNNDFLFRVSYYKNKINLEVFHSITDGNGAIEFLKAITYNYIISYYNLKISQNLKNSLNFCSTSNIEDSYIKNYRKDYSAKHNMKKAYNLKGSKLALQATGAIHGIMNLDTVLNFCRSKKVTITQYFTSCFIWAIYKENMCEIPAKKPIKIYLPVNLRKFFNSTTTTNFFSFITAEVNFKEKNFSSFDDLLYFVSTQFKNKLTKEHLTEKISSNVSAEKNLFVRLIPLFIKKFGVKIGYIEASKHHSATLSNIGTIDILPEFKQYIENFNLLIAPSRAEKMKCSVCSYENSLTISFASSLENTNIQKDFFRHLVADGIDVIIESNGVYNENM